ncbi:MAG: SDR family oxidoreductase, partial [Acidiferrobacterales bacterium]|nr:SDR family oxidoreductase [Acidiferrobacterales bacterium]
MQLSNTRVLLTGACGGIGREIAALLARAGAHVVLAGREVDVLQGLCSEIRDHGSTASVITVDLAKPNGPEQMTQEALAALGHIDVLINNAGILDFRAFAEQAPGQIERLYRINLIGPVLLTRAVLPHMLRKGSGHIVNIGSTFGSIAFAYFVAYSSSKFAMRGFSEALRRELEDTDIQVTYIAPRATQTRLNSAAVYRMNQALGIGMDAPKDVAALIVRAIERDARDVYIGWPERLFVRINAVLPGLVDRVMRRQHDQMAN